MGPDDLVNPFKYLAGEAGKVIADGWTSAMLGLWNAGLWALRLVLNIIDALLTPDLSENGPGAVVYRTTFWLAGALVLIMLMIQLGLAAIRRSGKSLAVVLLGLGQFLVVWGGWVGFGVAVVYACGGLTRALMRSLLNVTSWSTWQPWAPFSVDDITDGTVATVLGLMGLLLWLAAIGHLLVMITRSAALIVLAAITPAAAAGLVSDAGRTWFWKSLRWFLAAAFTPVLMVLMLGIGVQITTGVANGLAEGTQQAIGTALPGVILILIACRRPGRLVQAVGVRRPEHQLRRRAAHRNGRGRWCAGICPAAATLTPGPAEMRGLMAAPRVRRRRRTRPTPGCSTPRPGCSARSAAPPAVPQPPRWEPSTPSGPAPPPSGPTSPTRWESGI